MRTTQQQVQVCPNCQKTVSKIRLPIHIHMCSAIRMRQTETMHHYDFESQFYKNTKDNQEYRIKCMYCNENVLSNQVQQHLTICSRKMSECSYCRLPLPSNSVATHEASCLYRNDKAKSLGKPSRADRTSGFLQNIKTKLNNFQTVLTRQGNKLSDKCNRYIRQNNGPTLTTLRKFKDNFQQKFGELFSQIAWAPNARPMPRKNIEQIQQGMYTSKNEEQLCTICYCQFFDKEEIKILECRHIFHPACIDKWMKINSTCPVCKLDQLNKKYKATQM